MDLKFQSYLTSAKGTLPQPHLATNMASERKPPIPTSVPDSTPVSVARRAQVEEVRTFTPLRRREVENISAAPSSSTSTESQEASSANLIAKAISCADAEINAIRGSDENVPENIVSRLGLFADNVTKRRLERVHAVSSRRDGTDDLRARVATAREAAKPALSPEERRNRLGELSAERSALVADILAATEHTKHLESTRNELASSVAALKRQYEALRHDDDERLSFYAWVNELLRKTTAMRIYSSPDSGRINGFVSTEHDIVSLDIDLEATSQFDAVNKIWSYISAGDSRT